MTKNIIVLWKRYESVQKEASIFDGVRPARSVVDVLSSVVWWSWESQEGFSGSGSMWYVVIKTTWRQPCLDVQVWKS